jgi:hypothetical protein
MQNGTDSPAHSRDMAAPVMKAAAAVDSGMSINNNNSVDVLLGARQEQDMPWGCGGHNTGGCTVYNMCLPGLCGRAERMSCVVGYVHIRMHPIDTEVELAIYEDGEVVCLRTISCLTINSPGCLADESEGEFDCGGGNKIAAWTGGLSVVDYVSSKSDGRHCKLYLGQDGGDLYYPCMVTVRLWALCVDSDWSGAEGLCQSSSSLRPRDLELGRALSNVTNAMVPAS